jgi:hypothetical protein
MSRKTIAIQIPRKPEAAPAPARSRAKKPAGVEQWVSQTEAPVEVFHAKPAEAPRVAGFTVAIPAEPNFFDAVRIGVFMPYAAMWLWTFSAARKSFSLFAR